MASNAIVQCSSSSSHSKRIYDVFVSFRGEDTRNNFTGFLFQALSRKGIDAFKDDADLKKGESIAPELLQAIEGSRIFVVVFSKNYASSTWCLRELVHICNCVETSHRHVLPIFYDVDPSDVRKQDGYYKEAFAKYEERFREDKEKTEEMQRWREALTHMANLSGWDIRNKAQHAEIDEMVQKIINLLGPNFSRLPNDHLVGMEFLLEELTELLQIGSINNIRVLGISGMAGIGKTTLGRALYERISYQYDFHCFIDNVSKIYRDSGALGVQKQLLSQSINEKNLEICNVSEGTRLVWSRLGNVRALIVLDNVDQFEQLRMFSGNRETMLRECLGEGSKVIIISRDEHILRTYGVDDLYQVQPLNWEHAVQLFSRNAFKCNTIKSDYEKLTHDVLSHVQGHPLAIEVFGSFLFGRSTSQWKSALGMLSENKSKKITDMLRISFDELDDMEKEIFLDIACFFNWEVEHQYLKEMLDFRGFHPELGLQVLIDKSLITIEDGYIFMHGLLVDLGKYIIREKSPKEPRKWSRLWDFNDLHQVMSDNMVAENIEAIVVDDPEAPLQSADALSKMSHLKVLQLQHIKFSGSLNYLSNQLGYLTWQLYPFDCLPQSFHPHKLVELCLCFSNITKLWEGTKPLNNLKRLELSHSLNLIETPNFSEALNLESLCLEGCMQLRKIDPSIGLLRKLTWLNLKYCKNVVILPKKIFQLNSLEYLNLHGCYQLYNIRLLDEEARDVEHWKKFCTGETSICSHSTWSIITSWFTSSLRLLYSGGHKDSAGFLLPSSLAFSCMHHLDLSFCNLVQIPDAIGNLHFLVSLDLMGNNFATLPNLKELSKLLWLDLTHCKQLKYLPELPSQTDISSTSHKTHYSMGFSGGRQRDYWGIDFFMNGLKIYNCPEIVDREHCMSKCFSWMMQMVQADHRYNRDEFYSWSWRSEVQISSIIPGSIIPRWFNNQHVSKDHFINIEDASHFMQHDNNWIGLACSAIFVVRNGRRMDPPKIKGSLMVCVPLFIHAYTVTNESDHHLLLSYISRANLIGEYPGSAFLDGLTLEFQLCCEQRHHFEAKKYGYRWVYEKDLQLSSSTMMHTQNSLSRKRKFLAIEEN